MRGMKGKRVVDGMNSASGGQGLKRPKQSRSSWSSSKRQGRRASARKTYYGPSSDSDEESEQDRTRETSEADDVDTDNEGEKGRVDPMDDAEDEGSENDESEDEGDIEY